MAADVVDATYFHINSNANLSPHDLMRRGAVLEIGTQSNPFCGLYETYQRTYGVRQQDGSLSQVPAIEFLRRVKDGHVTADNLAVTAWQTARHFMMLARELVWENIRLAEFRGEPSRWRCLFLIEREEEVREWLRVLGFQPMTHWIVKLRVTGRILKADSRFLAGDSEPLPVWYDKARRYWRGEVTENPLPEVLFEGKVTVEEILDAANLSPTPR